MGRVIVLLGIEIHEALRPPSGRNTGAAQALCTWITCEGIEKCRLACGGHGYSLLSGLPTLYASYVQVGFPFPIPRLMFASACSPHVSYRNVHACLFTSGKIWGTTWKVMCPHAWSALLQQIEMHSLRLC